MTLKLTFFLLTIPSDQFVNLSCLHQINECRGIFVGRGVVKHKMIPVMHQKLFKILVLNLIAQGCNLNYPQQFQLILFEICSCHQKLFGHSGHALRTNQRRGVCVRRGVNKSQQLLLQRTGKQQELHSVLVIPFLHEGLECSFYCWFFVTW